MNARVFIGPLIITSSTRTQPRDPRRRLAIELFGFDRMINLAIRHVGKQSQEADIPR